MLCTIVGAGPGLGVALAERFAAEGYDVGLVARHPERLEAWRSAHTRADRIALRSADVADGAALRTALADLAAWAGPTEVLVYNAADLTPGHVDDLTTDALLSAMTTDVGGAIDSVRAVVPAMRAAGRGTILLTGGGLALEPYPEWAALAAGKAALRSLGLSLHKALLPQGVHVAVVAICGVVAPGTPFDPAIIAERYWQLHREPLAWATRELVHLPEGADPYYNDPGGAHRATSLPIDPGC